MRLFFSDRATLRNRTSTTKSALGEPIWINTDTVVWCDKHSVTRSEFFKAEASGNEAKTSFSIHSEDWGEQEQIVYEAKVYKILRAYQIGEGIVELTCTDLKE